MKALITDEYGEYGSIVDAPDNIIMDFKKYLLEFDNYGHPESWGIKEFINYLNDVILKVKNEKVTIVELWTNDYDKNLPVLYI